MNRRNFIKTAVAIGVIAALPALPETRETAEYLRGDIRRYGAVAGQDCTAAIQAALDDSGVAHIPAGTWKTSPTIVMSGYRQMLICE